ncbi:hypothetical protein ROQ65_06305 [Lactobacillus crispatus]|uniref:hypothetical protein n=1 Tax=Lactobacillus crispatus TaxID=47770 RepID=UPI0028E915E1|nr:hypothetical protein [Lactobacillus crispatus]MDT9604170.1 hypothetical protein [Lactobacillus crispatus]
MKSKQIKISLLAAALLASVASFPLSTLVSADTTSQPSKADLNKVDLNQHTSVNLSQSDIELADQYVEVKNNQFYITPEGERLLPNNVIQSVNKQVEKTNQAIIKDRLIIDPQTKEVSYQSPFVMFASGFSGSTRIHSGCYVRGFWWGVRIYFTSNAAVNWFIGKLGTASGVTTIVGMVAQVTGHEIAGTLSDALGAYTDSTSNRLANFNRKHRHSKIYMDAPNISNIRRTTCLI